MMEAQRRFQMVYRAPEVFACSIPPCLRLLRFVGWTEVGMQGLLKGALDSQEEFVQLRAGLRRGLAEQAVIGLVGSQKPAI